MSEKVSKTDLNNNDSPVAVQIDDTLSTNTVKSDAKTEPKSLSASVNKLATELDKTLAISKSSDTTKITTDNNNNNVNSTKSAVVSETAESNSNNLKNNLKSPNETSPNVSSANNKSSELKTSENYISATEYDEDSEEQEHDEIMQQMASGNTTNDPG
jgi:hypothetical protein